MEALQGLRAELHFEIFTTVPEWFFADSARGPFACHPLRSDVGLVQRSPLEEDPRATVALLEEFVPFDEVLVERLAADVTRLGCAAVVVDIAPLGIVVAERAGLPSILVENFTWDWIYEGYFDREPRLRPFADYFGEQFERATSWVQTEPRCRPVARARQVPPVSRRPRTAPSEVRRRLGVDANRPMVLLTMGGAAVPLPFLDRLAAFREAAFVVLANAEEVTRRDNLILLTERSPVYLPDLMAAADLIVGKVGYSTVAEAYAARTRYAMVVGRSE